MKRGYPLVPPRSEPDWDLIVKCLRRSESKFCQIELEEAVAAERERCAEIAYSHAAYRGSEGDGYDYNLGYQHAASRIVAAIRKVPE